MRDGHTILKASVRSLSAVTLILFCLAGHPALVQAAANEGTEIKLMIATAGVDQAMKALNLRRPAPKQYRIYFVDTPDLTLISGGVILRLRDKGTKKPETETTIKFRPDDQSKVPKLPWPKQLEKETEWLVGKGQNLSYVLENEIPGTKFLEDPSENLSSLFSAKQKAFFELIAKEQFDPAKLKVFGPISAEIWEWNEPSAGGEVSAESWKLGDEQIFELSMKAETGDLKTMADKFESVFQRKGIAVDPNPESKTRKALKILLER